jgi:LysM repeat protein
VIGSPLTRPTLAALGLTAVAALGCTALAGGTATAAPVPPSAPARPSAATGTPTSVSLASRVTPLRRTHPSHRDHRRTYTVRPGDSFWSIAAAEKVSWYNLAADNGLQLYSVLDVGQVLELPRAGEARHAPMPLEPGAAAPTASTTATDRSIAPAVVSPTPAAPTAAASPVASGGGFEQCVISRESGGDPDASNGSYWGLFQFSPSTWAAYGGDPSAWGNASAAEQQQVFANAVADGGESNWAPYDGC